MHLKLRGQELKTILYKYRLLYKYLMGITSQTSIIDTQKKRNPNIKDSHQITKDRNNNYKNYPKTINKMAIRTCIAINTSNVNGLNAPKDIRWLKAKKKKRNPSYRRLIFKDLHKCL